MVQVIVSRLGLDSTQNQFVVILQEKDGERILPIWIGRAEAESIAAHLNGVRRERPMTHDLCQSLILALGGSLQSVRVTRVHEGTFYAEMHVQRDGKPHVVDARPSDSIAIALRLNAPIFAADELLVEYASQEQSEEGGVEEPDVAPDLGAAGRDADVRSAEQLKKYLEQLRPEDFGKFRL